jgi:hypothetical protein
VSLFLTRHRVPPLTPLNDEHMLVGERFGDFALVESTTDDKSVYQD